MASPHEPTADQCNSRCRLPDWEGRRAYACWYPQMGGYHAKAVVVVEPGTPCFYAYVWHDGEFPFCGSDRDPACIHHCDAGQFVEFGRQVAGWQK